MAHLNNKNPLPNSSGGPTCFSGRPSFRSDHPFKRHFIGNPGTNLFPSLEDNHLIPRQTDALVKHGPSNGGPHLYGTHHPTMAATHPSHMEPLELMEPLCAPSLPPDQFYPLSPPHHHHHHCRGGGAPYSRDEDPRDLESFAERFKQRRIKLGVTQADVGRALVHLKLPGVGTLSQSTICRFESLTLSRNNMLALRPVLRAWLEAAELQARGRRLEAAAVLPSADKKRKRTSIAALEKRSLEAYFAVQQRPSGDKIASIAEKLDLKKSVVRVWFCNQRQKQKRMKYSANQIMN